MKKAHLVFFTFAIFISARAWSHGDENHDKPATPTRSASPSSASSGTLDYSRRPAQSFIRIDLPGSWSLGIMNGYEDHFFRDDMRGAVWHFISSQKVEQNAPERTCAKNHPNQQGWRLPTEQQLGSAFRSGLRKFVPGGDSQEGCWFIQESNELKSVRLVGSKLEVLSTTANAKCRIVCIGS